MWVRLFTLKFSKLSWLGHSDSAADIQVQAESVEIVGSVVIFRGTTLKQNQPSVGSSSDQSGLAG